MKRKYHYEIQWQRFDGILYDRKTVQFASAEFCRETDSEFDAITYAMDWMKSRKINASNLMYCRVEEVFDSEMRTNVLLWIEE